MIIAKDYLEDTKYSSIKIPKLKGHVKLTLHNVHNKKNEVIEGDNIITNAVADILANPYLNSLDINSMLPLWEKWYGGVLCFQNTHALHDGVLDPDQYFPRADSINHLTAHAGQTAIDVDHDDDMTRGNPTKSAYIKTESSIKQVFEWNTTHGNGQISALSLTHSDTGSYGLGNTGYHFKNSFNPFARIDNLSNLSVAIASVNNIHARYDDNHALAFAIGEDGSYQFGNVRFTTNKVTVYVRKLPFYKAGLYETLNLSSAFQRMFTVECTHTFRCMPAYYFDPSTKYLWLFDNITGFSYDTPSWNKQNMSYVVIDCENEDVVDEGVIVSDASDLAPSCVCNQNSRDGNSSCHRYGGIVIEGNYVYLPTSTGSISGGGWLNEFNIYMTGYKKININSQADQTALVFNDTYPMHRSAIKNGDFIISSGRIMNGAVGYSCVDTLSRSWAAFAGVYSFADINKSSFVVYPVGSGSSSSSEMRAIFANKMILSSKFNLNPVQKTSSHSMIVEYTIQEVSGND